jgi:hypothetical protein
MMFYDKKDAVADHERQELFSGNRLFHPVQLRKRGGGGLKNL